MGSRRAVLAFVAVLAAVALLVPAALSSNAADVLPLDDAGLFGVLKVASCPSGSSPKAACFEHNGDGAVRGLGSVAEHFILVIEDSTSCGSWSLSAAVLTVSGKGTISLSARTAGCLGVTDHAELAYVITGGTGLYAGASGRGTIASTGTPTTIDQPGTLRDTYRGTLIVHGLIFDLTAPTIQVPTKKIVKVKRHAKAARVGYAVRAEDDKDGTVPAICKPASGRRFRVGRTTVKCTATDSSANASEAEFLVIVKRRRH